MRRFKRKCEKSGILSELKKRQHYEKPSAKRKRKMIQARKKMLRKLSEERRATPVTLRRRRRRRPGSPRVRRRPPARFASLARTPPGRAAVLSLAPAPRGGGGRAPPRRDRRGRRVPDPPRPPAAGGTRGRRARCSTRSQASGGAGAPRRSSARSCARRARRDAVRRALAKAEAPLLSARLAATPRPSTRSSPARRGSSARTAMLKDDASPALAATRAKLRRRRGEVSRQLEKILGERRDALGDAVVVLRNDRYCLPVLASARAPRARASSTTARAPARRSSSSRSRSSRPTTISPFSPPRSGARSSGCCATSAARSSRRAETSQRPSASSPRLDALEAKVGLRRDGRGAPSGDLGRRRLDARRRPASPARCALREAAPARPRRVRARGGDAVPLDFELPADRRLLVVSGPNAGGKTVVLKTAGLFSMLAQCGIPIPAARRHASAGLSLDPHRDRRRAGDPLGPLHVLLLDGDAGRDPRRGRARTRSR